LFYWGGFRGFSNLLRFIKGLCQNCPDVSHLCDVWSYWIPLLYIYVLMDVVRTTHKFLAIIWQCVYHWCKWWTNEWNIWSVILAWNWTLLCVLQKCGLNCFGFIYLFEKFHMELKEVYRFLNHALMANICVHVWSFHLSQKSHWCTFSYHLLLIHLHVIFSHNRFLCYILFLNVMNISKTQHSVQHKEPSHLFLN